MFTFYPQEVENTRILQVYSTIDITGLYRYFLDVKRIMARHDVSRATAYRYLSKIPDACKIKVRLGECRPYTMGQIVAIDRAHANAKRGNPHLSPAHQKRAAQQRWPQFETDEKEKS